jgi:hypothetical protein
MVSQGRHPSYAAQARLVHEASRSWFGGGRLTNPTILPLANFTITLEKLIGRASPRSASNRSAGSLRE